MIHKVVIAPMAHTTSTHTAGSTPATTGTTILLGSEVLLLTEGIAVLLAGGLILLVEG